MYCQEGLIFNCFETELAVVVWSSYLYCLIAVGLCLCFFFFLGNQIFEHFLDFLSFFIAEYKTDPFDSRSSLYYLIEEGLMGKNELNDVSCTINCYQIIVLSLKYWTLKAI